MDGNLGTLIVWSYGLATAGYALLAASVANLNLLSLGYGLTGSSGLYAIAMEADILRYGAWFAFVLLVLKPTESEPDSRARNHRHVSLFAGFIVVVGIVVQVRVTGGIGLGGLPRIHDGTLNCFASDLAGPFCSTSTCIRRPCCSVASIPTQLPFAASSTRW